MRFAEHSKCEQSCTTPIPLNPPISSAAVTSFTHVPSGITVNMYVMIQTYRNDNSGSSQAGIHKNTQQSEGNKLLWRHEVKESQA